MVGGLALMAAPAQAAVSSAPASQPSAVGLRDGGGGDLGGLGGLGGFGNRRDRGDETTDLIAIWGADD